MFNRKWFKNLKDGDKVLVRIYSKFCECTRESTVLQNDGKNITARMSEEVHNNCVTCANLRAIDDDGENTCYYFVTKFSKGDVKKLKSN